MMVEYNCTPPHITVKFLKDFLTGYCNTCPHSQDTEHCCQSGCTTLRILADLETLVAERRVVKLAEFDSMSGWIAVPQDLAERSLRRCVRHGDN